MKENKFSKMMNKRLEKRMKELYEDKEFRIKLEEETQHIKSIKEINEYNKKAFDLAKEETKQ